MLGAGHLRARGAERGERVGPVAREGEREWAARERVEVWAQARAAMGRRGGNRCGELGWEAADWAGAGFAGPSGKERWAAGWAVVLGAGLGLPFLFLFLSLFYF